MRQSTGKVFIGFNRPASRFNSIIKKFLSQETGPAMYNWFIVGHQIGADHWYMNPGEGGRILGNFCHWTDFILNLTSKDMYPIEINPTRGDRSDANLVATYRFSDETTASITFSEKGDNFEGVRERFTAHKGNCLIYMQDFERLEIEVADWVKTYKNLFRDHGHESNITAAYNSVKENLPYDKQARMRYVWNTGMLFLKTKEALENDEKTIVYADGCRETELV